MSIVNAPIPDSTSGRSAPAKSPGQRVSADPPGRVVFDLLEIATTDAVAARVASIAEQQRRELVQAAPPGLPLVRRVRRHVVGALDAQLLQRVVVGLGGGGAAGL